MLEIESVEPSVDLDNLQISSTLLLFSLMLKYFDMSLPQLSHHLDKLTQSCMIGATIILTPSLNDAATGCLEKIFKLVKRKDINKFSLLFKSTVGLLLERLNDKKIRDVHLRMNFAQNLLQLTKLIKTPIYDTELEINSLYSEILTAIRTCILLIVVTHNKITDDSNQLEIVEYSTLEEEIKSYSLTLNLLLAIAGAFIKIHLSISKDSLEDLYFNLFVKLSQDQKMMVARSSTSESRLWSSSTHRCSSSW
jgi:hypothetical protein